MKKIESTIRCAVRASVIASGLAIVALSAQAERRERPARAVDAADQMTLENVVRKRAREAQTTFELRAVGEVGGVPVALIDINGEPGFAMADMDLIAGRRVVAIDVARGVLTIRPGDGLAEELPVTNPRPIEWPVLNDKTVEHMISPEGQRALSDDALGGRLPFEVLRAWPKINREGKEEILLNYLRRGLVMCHAIEDGQVMGTSRARLFKKQAQERLHELREAFLTSLTTKQRERFLSAKWTWVHLNDSADVANAVAERNRLIRAEQDKVIASLTPEQRKLYQAWRGE